MAYAAGRDLILCVIAGALASVTVRIALIDLKLRIIQDRDLLILAVLGLISVAARADQLAVELGFALLRGLCYAGFFEAVRVLYRRLRSRDGIGFGDVKLIGALSPLVDLDAFPAVIAVAAAVSVVVFHIYSIRAVRRGSHYSYIPFGCSLSIVSFAFWIIQITMV